MQELRCEEIIEATNGELISGNINTIFAGISTDSRKIKSRDLFVPIVGERFDGHDFIEASLGSGASGTLTQRECLSLSGGTVIKVENTLKALADIAAYYRQKFSIPFIGITGSVGKTSTKEMIACVLSRKYRVLKNEGNLNNEIGVPQTIFNLEDFHEAAVLEMGMNGFGEISRLTSIVRPDIAVITNIGLSHIENLGSRQNILKAKMEIFEGLSEKGIAILNGDDKLLYGLKDLLKYKTVYYGMEEGLDYQAYNVQTWGERGSCFDITLKDKDYRVNIYVPGVHNIYNALAAIAVGLESGISMDDIIEGIAQFRPAKMRLDIISYKGIKIIDDTYNASPQSMEAAINVLREVAGDKRTVAVLGDMLEMGKFGDNAHISIGKFAVLKGIDYIISVGENARRIVQGALEAGAKASSVFSFKDNAEAGCFLKGFVQDGDVILVKGSRGMKMEEIVNLLAGRED
jgi:UDP-N-acetylmuramoyl-tripeptide--D-alanyl-D-alanine ligase